MNQLAPINRNFKMAKKTLYYSVADSAAALSAGKARPGSKLPSLPASDVVVLCSSMQELRDWYSTYLQDKKDDQGQSRSSSS